MLLSPLTNCKHTSLMQRSSYPLSHTFSLPSEEHIIIIIIIDIIQRPTPVFQAKLKQSEII